MSDVLERLRTAIRHRNLYKEHILYVAADQIERLRERIEELDEIIEVLTEVMEGDDE